MPGPPAATGTYTRAVGRWSRWSRRPRCGSATTRGRPRPVGPAVTRRYTAGGPPGATNGGRSAWVRSLPACAGRGDWRGIRRPDRRGVTPRYTPSCPPRAGHPGTHGPGRAGVLGRSARAITRASAPTPGRAGVALPWQSRSTSDRARVAWPPGGEGDREPADRSDRVACWARQRVPRMARERWAPIRSGSRPAPRGRPAVTPRYPHRTVHSGAARLPSWERPRERARVRRLAPAPRWP